MLDNKEKLLKELENQYNQALANFKKADKKRNEYLVRYLDISHFIQKVKNNL